MSQESAKTSESVKKKNLPLFLEYASYAMALFSVIIGSVAVFKPDMPDHFDKALLWFVFALAAIMIPYIKEISFDKLKIIIGQIEQVSKTLEGAALTSKELVNRLNKTRDELIDGYQELLRLLPEEERNRRVLTLSRLYLDEMGIRASTVKAWLVELGLYGGSVDDELDDAYLEALRTLQTRHGLGDDGIFGYRTLDLIIRLRRQESDA